MTSPVNQLAGLSISGGMSSRTRVEAQRERRRREREERISQAARQDNLNIESPGLDLQGAIHGSTQLQYQVGALSSPVRATAIRGLTADNLSAEASKVHVLGDQSSYVAIQIAERLRLCIYTTPRDGRYIDCSCAQMRSEPSVNICPHIYWLYDRMNSIQRSTTPLSTWPVALSDVERVLGQITRRPSMEIDSLAEDISPSWTESDDEIDNEVEDILAVLDSDTDRTPGEYDEEFYSNLPTSSNHRFQDLAVPGDLFSTIFALARHDPVLRQRLATVVTRERSDRDFFRKLQRRQASTFDRLDAYMKRGTSLNPRAVGRCAIELRSIVTKLEEYRQRTCESPNPAFDRACSKVTTRMLLEICRRNQDIYSGTNWHNKPSPGAPQDRNLFYHLMSGWNQTTNNASNFILDFLTDELPPPASIKTVQDLSEALTKLKEYKASARSIAKLNSLIQAIRTEPQPPLSELENFQSLTPSSTRSLRTNSQSSVDSCSSTRSGPSGSHQVPRRLSNQEMPDPRRRRLQ